MSHFTDYCVAGDDSYPTIVRENGFWYSFCVGVALLTGTSPILLFVADLGSCALENQLYRPGDDVLLLAGWGWLVFSRVVLAALFEAVLILSGEFGVDIPSFSGLLRSVQNF